MQERTLDVDDDSICRLVLGIARALVDEGDLVSLEVIQVQGSVTLRLHVASSEIGKVIGKQGRTARSIRAILGAASMKLQRRYCLDIQ
jgi:predicted RNA-binding protein YlqC (UPF0109 family)